MKSTNSVLLHSMLERKKEKRMLYAEHTYHQTNTSSSDKFYRLWYLVQNFTNRRSGSLRQIQIEEDISKLQRFKKK